MLKSLKIKNFRCFEEFDLPQLGRVNLLVGRNNSGKTSVLEAIHILYSQNLRPFWEAIERRGEHIGNSSSIEIGKYNSEIEDISNIKNFCLGHGFSTGKIISVFGETTDGHSLFELSWPEEIIWSENIIIEIMTSNTPQDPALFKWTLLDRNNEVKSSYEIPLKIWQDFRVQKNNLLTNKNSNNTIFISFNSTKIQQTIHLFEQVEMTSREDILLEALRFIEPKIQRIASTSTSAMQGYKRGQKGGFKVLIDGQRVPIGSMGDGIWWMLEIILAMVNIPGGTLLIDEIDTGLHFSVMIDLWKLICKTAEKLDIQVFATTHNSDCWKSLAEVANSDDIASNDITIHRIERGKKESIVFNEQEMAIAAERDIEVR